MQRSCLSTFCSSAIFLTFIVLPVHGIHLDKVALQRSAGRAQWRGLIPSTQHDQRSLGAGAKAGESEGSIIPYQWGPGAIKSLREDAARYEAEIWALLHSPLADWQILRVPQEEYTFGVRPVDIDGVLGVVSYFSAEYSTQGGRALFKYLTTAEGFKIINPEEVLVAEARAIARTEKAPNGATAYAEARLVEPPEGSGQEPSVALAGEHWQLCGEHALTSFVYPAQVPVEERLPEIQALAGVAPEFSVIYSLRIRQKTPETIQLQQLFWISSTQGLSEADAIQFHEESYAPIHQRLRKHLQDTFYPPDSGEECSLV